LTLYERAVTFRSMPPTALEAARAGDASAFARLVSPHKRELLAHCYRMSGSMSDAKDLLQESLIRAWKGLASFEGRSSLRTWLYRVTTHACLDALDKRSARVLPTDLGPALGGSAAPPPAPHVEPAWIEPCSTDLEVDVSPEARFDARESVALAFLTALQHLPPKQRAVLLLRDVLGLEASECAELLDMNTAAVNSALQRARESTEARARNRERGPAALDEATASLLARYVQAWEMADVNAFVSLLHEDATLAMPPLAFWLRGPQAIGESLRTMVLTPDSKGSFRLVLTRANGEPALVNYRRDASGVFRVDALQVVEIVGDRVRAITAFLNPSSFASFGLPATLPG
jgi:RNA polymerase sigma-70 factor (ECF subfamily)